MPMAATAKKGFGILNLDHWDLGEIWFLVLGIFMFFNNLINFRKIRELFA